MGAHIIYGSTATFATSDPDLYPVAAQVGPLVNNRASRTDITAVVGEDAGHGAPACFVPALAEVHLNSAIIDLGPIDKVDLKDDLWRLSHPEVIGALCHEASHAEHSIFEVEELMNDYGATRKMIDVITTLEEPRIEGLAVRKHRSDKVFLRGCAMEIVARDFTIPDTKYGAASAAGLLLARVDAGILAPDEVKGFRDDIAAVLGDETLDALEPLWQRFLRLRDDDYAGMVKVATAWLEALDEDPEDASDMVGGSMIIMALPGDPGEGKGEPSEGEGAPGFGEGIMAGVRAAAVGMDGEVVEKRADERETRATAEREADAARKAEGEKPHAEAFAPPGAHGYSPDGFTHLVSRREPTADERRAARTLAKTLERIDFRDKAVAKVASMVPPGRLRGRVAVQDAANRSMSRDSDVAMWASKRRVRVDSTPLTIGFAVDISGSMGAAMQPLASTQWVVSTAGAHIDAKVASVHFGSKVHGVTPAGVRETDVRLFLPRDGSECWKKAALALDRELDLLDGRGARLLFVASDGQFVVDTHKQYAQTFMPLAKRKGVAVIFLRFTDSMTSYGAPVVDCRRKTAVQVADLVGKAAIKEMTRLDRRV